MSYHRRLPRPGQPLRLACWKWACEWRLIGWRWAWHAWRVMDGGTSIPTLTLRWTRLLGADRGTTAFMRRKPLMTLLLLPLLRLLGADRGTTAFMRRKPLMTLLLLPLLLLLLLPRTPGIGNTILRSTPPLSLPSLLLQVLGRCLAG
jgi:hypothetical protein